MAKAKAKAKAKKLSKMLMQHYMKERQAPVSCHKSAVRRGEFFSHIDYIFKKGSGSSVLTIFTSE